ncbi:hypothetical protein Tco_0497207 [Tanacetum coccineum]
MLPPSYSGVEATLGTSMVHSAAPHQRGVSSLGVAKSQAWSPRKWSSRELGFCSRGIRYECDMLWLWESWALQE